MLGQAAHESGWGRREIRHADGSPSFNLFGIKAGADWKGAVAETMTTEVVNGQAVKGVARFRAYASHAESFADYARLMKDNPRYQQVLAQGQDASAFADRPAARRLRHRPGLCRQADARHQHHAAPAARRDMSPRAPRRPQGATVRPGEAGSAAFARCRLWGRGRCVLPDATESLR